MTSHTCSVPGNFPGGVAVCKKEFSCRALCRHLLAPQARFLIAPPRDSPHSELPWALFTRTSSAKAPSTPRGPPTRKRCAPRASRTPQSPPSSTTSRCSPAVRACYPLTVAAARPLRLCSSLLTYLRGRLSLCSLSLSLRLFAKLSLRPLSRLSRSLQLRSFPRTLALPGANLMIPGESIQPVESLPDYASLTTEVPTPPTDATLLRHTLSHRGGCEGRSNQPLPAARARGTSTLHLASRASTIRLAGPASCYISPYLPVSPYLPHLPISRHTSPHLPTPPHTSPQDPALLKSTVMVKLNGGLVFDFPPIQ